MAAATDPATAVEAPDAAARRTRIQAWLLAFAGLWLLLTGGLIEAFEQLEGDAGVGWVNLTFAVTLATIVVCVVALIGDSALRAVDRRMGRRPGARLVKPGLAIAGAVAFLTILVAHIGHHLALDGWIGGAGALVLLAAARGVTVPEVRRRGRRSPGRRGA